MIKLTHIEPLGGFKLGLTFSDGQSGPWEAAPLLTSRDTPLTIPLRDPGEFARAFIENGALAWPNGLELAPWTLHQQLQAAGLLVRTAA